MAFWGREGEGGGGQAGEGIGVLGGNTGDIVKPCGCTDRGRCCSGIGAVRARIVLQKVSTNVEQKWGRWGSVLEFRGQWQHGRPRDQLKAEVMERPLLLVRWRRRDHTLVLSSESFSLLLLPTQLRQKNLGRLEARVIHFFSVSMLRRPMQLVRTVTGTVIGIACLRWPGDVEVEGCEVERGAEKSSGIRPFDCLW